MDRFHKMILSSKTAGKYFFFLLLGITLLMILPAGYFRQAANSCYRNAIDLYPYGLPYHCEIVQHSNFTFRQVQFVTLSDYGQVVKWYENRGWGCDGACEVYFNSNGMVDPQNPEYYGVLMPVNGYHHFPLLLRLSVEAPIP